MTPSEAFNDHPVMLIANLLVIIGALNWLAVGLLHADYVTQLVGSEYSKYIFILVGIAGIYLAYYKIMWFSGKDSMEHMTGCKTVVTNGKSHLVCGSH